MFEYTALVDAPVQRFTGIVTGPDPDDDVTELVMPAVLHPEPPLAEAASEPILVMEPMPVEPRLPEPVRAELIPAAPVAPTPNLTTAPALPAGKPMARPVSIATPAPAPSLLPAIVAAAAAGLTALWWLRRDSHDR